MCTKVNWRLTSRAPHWRSARQPVSDVIFLSSPSQREMEPGGCRVPWLGARLSLAISARSCSFSCWKETASEVGTGCVEECPGIRSHAATARLGGLCQSPAQPWSHPPLAAALCHSLQPLCYRTEGVLADPPHPPQQAWKKVTKSSCNCTKWESFRSQRSLRCAAPTLQPPRPREPHTSPTAALVHPGFLVHSWDFFSPF